MFARGKSSPPPPSSTPTLPSLATLALQLSHTSVISGPISETYGSMTGERWTRWLLTHSFTPTRGIFLSPHTRKTGGSTENQPAHSYIYSCRTCQSTFFFAGSYRNFHLLYQQALLAPFRHPPKIIA